MSDDHDGVNRRKEFPSDLALEVWARIPQAFPNSRTTNASKPLNEFQALMEAAPYQTIERSIDEEEELREAVAAIVDLLTPKDRQVIESIFYEQDVPLREIERRIHVPKTSVSRLRERALMTLRDLMFNNETIRRRIMPDLPINWEEAARQVLLEITESTYAVEQYTTEVTEAVDSAYAHWNQMHEPVMWEELTNAGRIAWVWLTKHLPEWSEAQLFEEMIELLMERQAKYGHANILKFRDLGLCVRMSDKAARLGNLEEGGKSFDDESVIDTWMDVLGYSVIAGMLERDWFELELPDA